MENIKCPFCGQEINASAKFCPNCGAKLDEFKKRINADPNFVAPAPKDPSWVDKWKTKAFIWKFVFGLIFIFLFVLAIYFLPYTFKRDIESIDYSIAGIFIGIGAITSLIIFIYVAILCHVKVVKLDGYHVVIASGSYLTIVVEDVVISKKNNETGGFLTQRYLKPVTGYLPNNKMFVIEFKEFNNEPVIRFANQNDMQKF